MSFSDPTRQVGYLLPAVIMLGLGISTASVVALQTVARNSSSLNNQYYSAAAKEAAQAGVAAAVACINSNNGERVWGTGGTASQRTLTPKGCSRTPTGTDDFVTNNDTYTSTYRVQPITDLNNGVAGRTTSIITSVGSVSVKGPGGTIAQTIEYTARTQVQTGLNSIGTPGKKNVTQVSTGSNTACAITEDDQVSDYWIYCWGSNANLQLGAGRNFTYNRSAEPVAVYNNATNTNAIARGPCTVALFFGVCTSGEYTPPATPAQPGSPIAGKRAIKVSVGNNHTCAIAQDGTDSATRRAYCWGRNSDGQLGNESTTDSLIPIAVDTTAARAVVMRTPSPCGGWFQPSCTPVVDVPAKPASSLMNKTIVDISAGNGFTCALTSEGLVSCWGRNSDGQLGNNSTSSATVPTAVSRSGAYTSTTMKKLAVVKGDSTTMCAITTTDDGVCWGKSDVGQTGNGIYIDSTTRTGSANKRHSNANACNSLRQDVFETAQSQAGGSPHDDSDELRPVSVAGGLKFDSITVNDASTSGDSYENITAGTGTNPTRASGSSSAYVTAKTTSGRPYYWGGSRSFNSVVDCTRNGDAYGSDHSRAEATISRSYTGSTSPRLMYDATTGNLERASLDLASGNAFNGLFCATTNGSVYCDSRGGEPRDGQVGDGRVISCTTFIWTTCTPTPSSGAVRVSTTQQADTSTTHGSDMTIGMAQAVSSLDTGASGYSCAVSNLSVLCWGVNGSGQLGTGNTSNRFAPTYVYTGNSDGLGKTVSGGSGIPLSGTAAIGSNNGSIPNPTAAKSF